VAKIAPKLRAQVPDVAKRPAVTEFEHVVVAGLTEIVGRPIVVELHLELIVEEIARDAGP
jgi:hypothetical protein